MFGFSITIDIDILDINIEENLIFCLLFQGLYLNQRIQ